jgi:hypothetical protein
LAAVAEARALQPTWEATVKDETAFRVVKEALVENRENGTTFEGVLSRSRVAALRRVLRLAEPEFAACRRGNRVAVYRRAISPVSGASRYERLASVKLPARFLAPPSS